MITFGSDSNPNSAKTSHNICFHTTYHKQLSTTINPGIGHLMVTVPNREGWHTGALDHTSDDSGHGYMYLIDVNKNDMEIFSSTVNNICSGIRYEFSIYLANVCKKSWTCCKPNIRFEVRAATNEKQLLAQLSTNEIPDHDNMTWTKYGLSFVSSSSSIVLLIISNTGVAHGNDFAIDDIELSVCSTNHSGYCLTGQCIYDYLFKQQRSFTGVRRRIDTS